MSRSPRSCETVDPSWVTSLMVDDDSNRSVGARPAPGALPAHHNGSFWFDSLDEPPEPRPPAALPSRTDVAIVGGGFTGLWTAYYLRRHRPDLDIAVFEAETVGFGASGRNGGWCMGMAMGIDERLEAPDPSAGLALLHAMHDTVATTAGSVIGTDHGSCAASSPGVRPSQGSRRRCGRCCRPLAMRVSPTVGVACWGRRAIADPSLRSIGTVDSGRPAAIPAKASLRPTSLAGSLRTWCSIGRRRSSGSPGSTTCRRTGPWSRSAGWARRRCSGSPGWRIAGR